MIELTHEKLRELLRYDPETGSFFWIARRKGIRVGMEAGHIRQRKDGRFEWTIGIYGKTHRRCRLAWFWMTGDWPKLDMDHRDLNEINDRWSNLREATKSQNAANVAKRKGCKVPLKGVVRNKNRYQAQIKYLGKNIYIGLFETAELAHAAYAQIAIELNGEFARTA